MTAALKISSQIPADSGRRGPLWLDVDLAAQRLGFTARHMRRVCEQWRASGLSRKHAGRWQVAENADPRLSRVPPPEHRPFDHSMLGDAQRRKLAERLRILEGWRAAIAAGHRAGRTIEAATAGYLAEMAIGEGVKLSRDTLYAWQASYDTHGRAGLIDGRWRPAETKQRHDDPFYVELRRRFLHQHKLSVQVCYELARQKAIERGWECPEPWTARRYLKSLPPQVVAKHRGNRKERVAAEPFLKRDYSALASNEIWCADHHQFDVVVAHDGKLIRPWLTGFEDLRSRKIVGWRIYAHDPNADEILLAFRSACLSHGVPERVYLDNGKDFDSQALSGETKLARRRRRQTRGVELSVDEAQHVAGLFGTLGVAVTHAEPYNARAKPIERTFGTVCQRFSKLQRTYCGNSPDGRPEHLKARLAGGQAPPLDQFIAEFSEFIEVDYHQRPHFGDAMNGRTPAQVFDACLVAKRTTTAAELELLLQKASRPVRIGRVGVRYNGRDYGMGEPELIRRYGQQVILRSDPADISQVTIWTIDGKFICRALLNRAMPFNPTEQQWREAEAQRKRYRKTLREYHEVRPYVADDAHDLMIRAAAASAQQGQQGESQTNEPQPPPPSIRPVRSPMSDQLPALQRSLAAMSGRTAVGAESLTLDQISQAMSQAANGSDPESDVAAGEPDAFMRFGAVVAEAAKGQEP